MQVDLASSVGTKFRSKDAFLRQIRKLHRKGTRFNEVADPVLRWGLSLCLLYDVRLASSDYTGSLEEFICGQLPGHLAYVRDGECAYDPVLAYLGELFGITQEAVDHASDLDGHEPNQGWKSRYEH
jgi:hypothetical protein